MEKGIFLGFTLGLLINVIVLRIIITMILDSAHAEHMLFLEALKHLIIKNDKYKE